MTVFIVLIHHLASAYALVQSSGEFQFLMFIFTIRSRFLSFVGEPKGQEKAVKKHQN